MGTPIRGDGHAGRVRAEAALRIADVGGWSDTWFGSPGTVCHLAVTPAVQVEAALVARTGLGSPVHLLAPRHRGRPPAGPVSALRAPDVARACGLVGPPDPRPGRRGHPRAGGCRPARCLPPPPDQLPRARRVAALAALASHAASCLEAGDLEGWGATLTAATDGQSALHPDLVGPAHRAAIGCARDHGALGWKVNGAGGSGGSLTALVPNAAQARALAAAWRAQDPTWVVPDHRVCRPPAGSLPG